MWCRGKCDTIEHAVLALKPVAPNETSGDYDVISKLLYQVSTGAPEMTGWGGPIGFAFIWGDSSYLQDRLRPYLRGTL